MTDPSASSFAGAGGVEIFRRAWLPSGSPSAVVAIAHGAGEHSGRYAHVADRFTRQGYAVYAIDHRGHGRSQGPRALIDRMDNAVADLHRLIEFAAGRHPGVPLFLLGHSMGGTVAVSYALTHQDRLSGLILSGPLAAIDPVPAPARLAATTLSRIAPRTPAIRVDSSRVSRDPAVVENYRRDPLVHHGKLPVRTVAELAAAIEAFPHRVATIDVPTLILYGSEDGLCPPRGSEMLAQRIGSTEITARCYAGLYHEILNEPEREQVLDDICSWLAARVGAAARRSTRTGSR